MDSRAGFGSRRRETVHRNASTSAPRRSSSASSVLRALLDHGPVARSTIARLTGLSPASVTGHSAELAKLGLVRELPEVAGPKVIGRPHVPVDVATDQFLVGGIHIAVPHVTVALMDLRGRIVAQCQIPHGDADSSTILRRAASRLRTLLDADGRESLGVGVATGGWVDKDSGTIVEHPLLDWHDVRAREILTEATGSPVRVDAHSRALVNAERLFGQARTRASVLHLFIGNVVDAAFATGEIVHHGPRSAAGAIAHLPVPGSTEPCACGRQGCLQATVSEQTLARNAHELGLIAEPSFPDLFTIARAGEPLALELFLDRSRVVGQAAALLIDVLNPEVTVLVGQGFELPGCLSTVRDEVRDRCTVCDDASETVVTTSFPGTELATAAGAVLLDVLYGDPLNISFAG
jgi:predicted NBD/HSP70 family sugar kinase